MSDGPPPQAVELVDDITTMVSGGDTIEGAIRRLTRLGVPPQQRDAARLEYERRVGRIRELRDPRALVDDSLARGYWYPGSGESDVFWPAVKARLAHILDDHAVASVDDASNKIVGLLAPPGMDKISTRGLVLGYVQSGKTTNFTSVISKAADVGYRLFIVLSGITDNLRSQTQERLEQVLVGDLRQQWYLLTQLDADFYSPGNAANLLSRADHRLLAVIKKNPYRLHRLVRWLDSAGEATLRSCPIMIVDDEADQASIDVGTKGRTSRINGLIKQVLAKPKAAYLAYTATPFANLLVNPAEFEDIYPRDFIVDLPLPDGYFGSEKICGRDPLTPDEIDSGVDEGLDVVRHVPDEEIGDVQPPRGRQAAAGWEPRVCDSLGEAIRWFALATTARRVRSSVDRHSTMLIHTSMNASSHVRLGEPVKGYVKRLHDAVVAGDTMLLADFERQWVRETGKVPATMFGRSPVSWGQLSGELPRVLEDISVVIDNYMSEERLSYSDDKPTTAIVIGGNTLSRGLTLEGLVCSYFVRSASAYDTLLQMGRWFGYRSGYEDLPRVWMTAELESWFLDLATVEEEVRREIRRYEDEDLSPDKVPVKIRSHPAMAITSAAKMRSAVPARISFGGERGQTILFWHKDGDWLAHNIEATRRFIAGALALPDASLERNAEGRPLVRNVPSDLIKTFLGDYRFHGRAHRMRSDLLTGYISGQNQQGFLRRWNVVIITQREEEKGALDLGLDRPVNLIQRSRMDMPGISHANIKALVTAIDRVADIGMSREKIRGAVDGNVADDARLRTLREQVLGDVGLLCIYPISRDSEPRDGGPRRLGRRIRLPLEAVEDVIGIGLFFPEARGQVHEYMYYSADLSREAIEVEDTEIDVIDDADEAAAEGRQNSHGLGVGGRNRR